jgi:hypothetical protein
MFAASILGGFLFAAGHVLDRKGVLFASTVLDVAQLLLTTIGSYFALRALHDWIG